jgi:hypothetical protein
MMAAEEAGGRGDGPAGQSTDQRFRWEPKKRLDIPVMGQRSTLAIILRYHILGPRMPLGIQAL